MNLTRQDKAKLACEIVKTHKLEAWKFLLIASGDCGDAYPLVFIKGSWRLEYNPRISTRAFIARAYCGGVEWPSGEGNSPAEAILAVQKQARQNIKELLIPVKI